MVLDCLRGRMCYIAGFDLVMWVGFIWADGNWFCRVPQEIAGTGAKCYLQKWVTGNVPLLGFVPFFVISDVDDMVPANREKYGFC